MAEEIKTARSLQNLLVKAQFFLMSGQVSIGFLEALGSQEVGFSKVDFYKRQVVFGWPMLAFFLRWWGVKGRWKRGSETSGLWKAPKSSRRRGIEVDFCYQLDFVKETVIFTGPVGCIQHCMSLSPPLTLPWDVIVVRHNVCLTLPWCWHLD